MISYLNCPTPQPPSGEHTLSSLSSGNSPIFIPTYGHDMQLKANPAGDVRIQGIKYSNTPIVKSYANANSSTYIGMATSTYQTIQSSEYDLISVQYASSNFGSTDVTVTWL